jgi:hypothetical protein
MEVSILFIGSATATLRWLLKSIKNQNQSVEFTPDDLRSNPTTRVVLPMKTTSGEFIGTLTIEFLLEMPSPDAFRLLVYDVLVYLTEKIGSEEQWNIRNVVEQRQLTMYNVVVGKPEPGSRLPVGLQVDYKQCTDVQQFIQSLTIPTITRKAREINAEAAKATEVANATNIDVSNVPEIKVSEPPVDVDHTYSEYNFQ